MPATSVSVAARRVASLNGAPVIEREFNDRWGMIRQEIRPDNLRETLELAATGQIGFLQQIYQIMQTDGRYAGIKRALASAVGRCPIKIRPSKSKSPGAKLAGILLKEQYRRVNNVHLLRRLISPYEVGVTLWETPWRMESSTEAGKDLAFFQTPVKVPGRRLIMFNDPTRTDLHGTVGVTSQEFPMGRPISDFMEGSLLYGEDADAEIGSYDMAGTARACVSWWLAKQYTITFWSQFNETFAEPVRTAFVPPEYKDADRKKVERFLKFLGRNLYGVFDEDVSVDLLEATKTGTVTTYKELINMANDEMTVTTLGQVQTTDGGNEGSYAKAAVQWRVQRDIVAMICAMIEDTLYDLSLQFCKFNISEDFDPEDLPDVKPVPPRAEDRNTLADFYQKATRITKVSKRQIHEELELDEIEEGEETIGPEDFAQIGAGESQPVGNGNPRPAGKQPSATGSKPRSQGEQESD